MRRPNEHSMVGNPLATYIIGWPPGTRSKQMKISSIPSVYRHVNRLTEIVGVLSKYGLADWLSRLNLDIPVLLKGSDGAPLVKHTREVRIRMALAELGPTFIKLGQILSTRPDLVGQALAHELCSLQDQAPEDASADIRQIVEDELGQPIDDLFLSFEDKPIASASMGQVHTATLRTGEAVVVKVQHPHLQDRVRGELELLAALAQMAEKIPEFARYRPVATVGEFQRTIRRELDFGREERNLQTFASRFGSNPHVKIPQPFTELCTQRVLTMERLDGVKLADFARESTDSKARASMARRGAEVFLRMVFEDGFYHADPHPGNVVVLPGHIIGLLDFGMVERLDERLREDMEDMLMAIVNQDAVYLCALICRIGSVPEGLDHSALQGDVADFVGHYATKSLENFPLGNALGELSEMIYQYQIVIPSQVAMLIKLIVTLEGTARLLQPDFSLLEVMRPLQRKLWIRRMSPARRMRKLQRVYGEVEHLLESLPRRMMSLLDQVQSGKFDVHLDHRGLEPSVNRLVLGMIVSALFMGSALMLSRQVPPILFDSRSYFGLYRISILGLSGLILSILLGMRLLRAIGKSGHLDRRR